MIGALLADLTQLAELSDLALIVPELILVGATLVLLLLARRIEGRPVAAIVTIAAAGAAALVSIRGLGLESRTGFAGMIALDGYALFFGILTALTLILATLLAVQREGDEEVPRAEYHALLLLAAAGMMIAASSLDLLSLYLGLELVTICAYVLVGITIERPGSNEAAIKYFLFGSFASALLLFGISMTYGIAGTTELGPLSEALAGRGEAGGPLLLVAVGLVAAGLAFKIAAVPFHSWAPDAYQGASAPVAAFLATGSKAAGLAALGRVCLIGFGSEARVLSLVLVGLAALSIVIGSLVSLAQSDVKRLLAYSSIAHAGYALLGLLAVTDEGTQATMTYAFFYVFMTLGAFGVVIALGERGERVDGYRGLAAQRPLLAALMLLFLLSLTGIPPTAGFAAKFAVILSAVRAGHIALAVLAVLCSVVSAFVYLRLVVLMYMEPAQEPEPARLPVAILTALTLAALVTLLGGIAPGSLMQWAVAP